MLPNSRLYSFIDQKDGFTVHFFEGQKLIQDLAILRNLGASGFQYFRDLILSIQPLVSYLKTGESLGVYLDSTSPYFSLKIEMSDEGQMRTLLLPDGFNQFPEKVNGNCRVVKMMPGQKSPYNSVLPLNDFDYREISNLILKDSYQINSKTIISSTSDQSVMIMKLPAININKIETNYVLSIDEYWKKIESSIHSIFDAHVTDESQIHAILSSSGLTHLISRDIYFKCSCSRRRMVDGIATLFRSHQENEIFHEGQDSLDVKCDYCNTTYQITRDEVLAISNLN